MPWSVLIAAGFYVIHPGEGGWPFFELPAEVRHTASALLLGLPRAIYPVTWDAMKPILCHAIDVCAPVSKRERTETKSI